VINISGKSRFELTRREGLIFSVLWIITGVAGITFYLLIQYTEWTIFSIIFSALLVIYGVIQFFIFYKETWIVTRAPARLKKIARNAAITYAGGIVVTICITLLVEIYDTIPTSPAPVSTLLLWMLAGFFTWLYFHRKRNKAIFKN